MPDQIVTDTAASLRAAADFIERHSQLPAPYITSHGDGTTQVHWFLMLAQHDMSPTDQGIAALTIFDAIGGHWDEQHGLDAEDQPMTAWDQRQGNLRFHVAIRREVAEVCS